MVLIYWGLIMIFDLGGESFGYWLIRCRFGVFGLVFIEGFFWY